MGAWTRLWLKVWVSNHVPKLIGRWYLEHLIETKIISAMLRVDEGTETGTMATMHAFLRRHHNGSTRNSHTWPFYLKSGMEMLCLFPKQIELVEIELGTGCFSKIEGGGE